MNQTITAGADLLHQEALRRARKQAKEIRAFYISASMYAIIIPTCGFSISPSAEKFGRYGRRLAGESA